MTKSIVSERVRRALAAIPRIDYQRAAVYRWEAHSVYHDKGVFDRDKPLTLEQCRGKAAAEAAFLDMASAPSVEIDEVGRRPLAHIYRNRITLPRWALQPACLMHEMAHLKVHSTYHGRTFVSTYIDLLFRFGYMDRDELRSSARQFGVRL